MRKGYKKIEVYFPDAEYEAFLKKVKRTNLSISEFVRRMAAEQVIREAPHADVPYLMREVKRVGNNINQLLFLANSKGFFDVNDIRDYFPRGYTASQMSREILQALEERRTRAIRERNRDDR